MSRLMLMTWTPLLLGAKLRDTHRVRTIKFPASGVSLLMIHLETDSSLLRRAVPEAHDSRGAL